jgi:aryl-alcohol dehydrogenase-like predicted oxidoreductase
MQKRKLGNTGLELSVIGFGAWAIGGGEWEYSWGPQDEKDAMAAMLHALDVGINWIDTAAVYGLGHSEELVGKMLKEVRQKPIIATKCGITWDKTGKITRWANAEQVYREVEASLRRLKVETIDLYQLHWPFPDENLEEVWEAMATVKKQGKVRYIGVSNHTVEQMKVIAPIHPIASLQPKYSMIHHEIETDILPYCGKNNIGVVCYSPMAKGLLTGKFTTEKLTTLPDSDHRRRDPEFQGDMFKAHLKLIDGLRPIAQRSGITLSQLSLAWVLRKNEVTSAIAGARSPQQIEETAKAADIKLGTDDITEIEELIEQHDKTISKLNI